MANRTDQCDGKHTSRDCNLCASLRHPANSAKGRALAAHLREHPLPRQSGGKR